MSSIERLAESLVAENNQLRKDRKRHHKRIIELKVALRVIRDWEPNESELTVDDIHKIARIVLQGDALSPETNND